MIYVKTIECSTSIDEKIDAICMTFFMAFLKMADIDIR